MKVGIGILLEKLEMSENIIWVNTCRGGERVRAERNSQVEREPLAVEFRKGSFLKHTG